MISREELTRAARKKGFALAVVEKDYALTWALEAIYSSTILTKLLVFKGGTCLSKVYAENYRLSEDLDFSTFSQMQLSRSEFDQELASALTAANQRGAPNLEIIEKEVRENPGLLQFPIKYIGPLNHPGWLKLDISLKEYLAYAPQQRPLKEKTYIDMADFAIQCYGLKEILVEKLRAIMQRGKTRDYYDLWQLMTRKDLMGAIANNVDELSGLRSVLVQKCKFRQVAYEPEKMFDEKQLSEAEKEWQNSLGRLVKNLPDFSEVITSLKKIYGQGSFQHG